MNELFQITETKPTKLQSARRALADAEKELKDAQWLYNDGSELIPYERAVNRFSELVKAEELAELNKLQNDKLSD